MGAYTSPEIRSVYSAGQSIGIVYPFKLIVNFINTLTHITLILQLSMKCLPLKMIVN